MPRYARRVGGKGRYQLLAVQLSTLLTTPALPLSKNLLLLLFPRPEGAALLQGPDAAKSGGCGRAC